MSLEIVLHDLTTVVQLCVLLDGFASLFLSMCNIKFIEDFSKLAKAKAAGSARDTKD